MDELDEDFLVAAFATKDKLIYLEGCVVGGCGFDLFVLKRMQSGGLRERFVCVRMGESWRLIL